MLDSLDTWLSIIDIIICIVDIAIIVYLFFYRLPQEKAKQQRFTSRIRRRPNRQWRRRC
jgi:hypothetical protein